MNVERKYLARLADELLDRSLEASGAVLIEGAKWCGKTSTARKKAASIIYMQDPDYRNSYLKIADTKPSLLLVGDTPRLIDEWQIAPVLWDSIRHVVDERNETGQFMLTGSVALGRSAVQHSGTGRISRFVMRPMSLWESLESNGTVSLKKLFEKDYEIQGYSTLTIEKLAFAITRGGWPASITEKGNIALKRAYDYVEAVINTDISEPDNVDRNPSRVRALLRSLARNIATTANMSTIRNDMASDEDTISEKTIVSYINALRRIYVVEDLPAWNPSMRSKTALRTSPKRHFVDPSIASAVLRATTDSLLRDFNTFGFLFESLCIRDLRIYSQVLDGEVFHYRDKNGLEADAIVHLKDGRWGAIEVKLGSKEIEEACENLLKLKSIINLDKMKDPSFLMVLTGTEIAYQRKDGVYIVPIGCLKD
jgi:predicted AAA+ superfamily ATPase